jgi:DNA-binding XRE family transcriptional regulator
VALTGVWSRLTPLHNPSLYNLGLCKVKRKGSILVTVPEWAERVAALRKKLGLKQVEFARKFHVTQAAISLWESGAKQPSVENYIRMGNMASEPECFWFWEKAGVDVNRIRSLLGGPA